MKGSWKLSRSDCRPLVLIHKNSVNRNKDAVNTQKHKYFCSCKKKSAGQRIEIPVYRGMKKRREIFMEHS